MKVRDLMTSDVECVSQNDSLIQAAKIMKQENVGSVPVCNQDELLGIITDRDIVIRAVAEGKDISTVNVLEIMSKNPISVSADTDMHEAAHIMADHQIRRLPVTEKGRLIGILALGDLAVVQIHENEAGEALSSISQGVKH